MRGGIPIAARIFALAAMAFSKNDSVRGAPDVVQAYKILQGANATIWHQSGTAQRRRRKNARRIHNNGRR